MSNVFSDVEKFMRAVGQIPPDKPSCDSDLSELYYKLIAEEYEEFLTAEINDSDAGSLDACFDMIWVIVGYMKARGWDCEGAWEEGAKSNLSKIDPETGKVIRREDGKILKPDGWTPPDFKKFVR